MNAKKITAKEGKILTNGHVYGKIIYLDKYADADEFYEITEEEYRTIRDRENESE